MKTTQLLFSPTGGTEQVADTIADAWGFPVRKIDLCDAASADSPISLSPDDLALIAVPSYGGRVPALAAERIAAIRAPQTPCVLVCVYGNRAYEDTLLELNDLAQQSGFQVIAAIAAVAEHSIMHQYAAGRPDSQDREQLRSFAREIMDRWGRDKAELPAPELPGNRPYRKYGGVGLTPKANSRCTACGLCADKCPAQAIPRDNPKLTDSQKCISCMRCTAVCPQAARKVNSAMVSAAALAMKKACSARKENELF